MGDLDFAALRSAMVVSQLRTSDVNDERVIAAMARVPREAFLPASRAASAYIDRAVPLGNGRMLNPPLATGRIIVAADVQAGDKVLLIGAAGGYTAAVLADMGAHVVAVEPDAQIGGTAPMPGAVTLVRGPLAAGAPDHAPYDVILVDGAVDAVPASLTDQMAQNGRIVTGVIDRGVTRLIRGRKVGGALGYTSLFDMEMAVLPGFSAPAGFAF